MTQQQEDITNEMIDTQIVSLLIGRTTREEGLAVQSLVELIIPGWINMNAVDSRKASRRIEQRLTALRRQAFSTFYQLIGTGQSITIPKFLPYALRISKFVWVYINAIKSPEIDDVIELLYRKGDGALRASYTLERVFNLDVTSGIGSVREEDNEEE